MSYTDVNFDSNSDYYQLIIDDKELQSEQKLSAPKSCDTIT